MSSDDKFGAAICGGMVMGLFAGVFIGWLFFEQHPVETKIVERVRVVSDRGSSFKSGEAAYKAGVKPEANPFAHGPYYHDGQDWLEGWMSAKAEAGK
jgi:hypothetical protein